MFQFQLRMMALEYLRKVGSKRCVRLLDWRRLGPKTKVDLLVWGWLQRPTQPALMAAGCVWAKVRILADFLLKYFYHFDLEKCQVCCSLIGFKYLFSICYLLTSAFKKLNYGRPVRSRNCDQYGMYLFLKNNWLFSVQVAAPTTKPFTKLLESRPNLDCFKFAPCFMGESQMPQFER